MTKAQLEGELAKFKRLHAEACDELRGKENQFEFDREEYKADLKFQYEEGRKDYREALALAVYRGISFADLKELITGRIKL